MVVVNYSTVRNNLKSYCDIASDANETVLVTRKDDKNVVILSLDAFNRLTSLFQHNLPNVNQLSEQALNEELEKGYADMKAGRVKPASEVFAKIGRK